MPPTGNQVTSGAITFMAPILHAEGIAIKFGEDWWKSLVVATCANWHLNSHAKEQTLKI